MITPPNKTTVKVMRAFTVHGKPVKCGAIATYDRSFAAELISNGKAVVHDEPAEAKPAEAKTAKAKD